MTTAEENKQIARRDPEDIATERNLDLIDEPYPEDAVEHAPFGDSQGWTELQADLDQFLAAFLDFSATIEDIIAEGSKIAMRVTLQGTHEDEFMGIKPTGQAFEVQNMVFTRTEDGRVAERWIQPDMLGMLQRLGAVELPTTSRR